jgi:spoIIIJ-associated protein
MSLLQKLMGTDEDSKIKKTVKCVFKQIGFDVKIEGFDEYHNRKRLNLTYAADDVNVLVGKNGKNIMALEFLINIMLKNRYSLETHLMLDVNQYRKNKDVFLKDIALKAGEEVLKTGKDVILKPLNPYERKIVHTTLKKIKYVRTKSLGKGELKKILVTYARDEKGI